MKSINKLALRKFNSNKFITLGLAFMVIIGVGFFVILFTIATRYSETAEQYFSDYNYADCTFYGNFDTEDLNLAARQTGVSVAEGRYVEDIKDAKITYRIISLCENINKPYFYSGNLPADNIECLILKKNADAMNIKIDDILNIGEKNLKVSGLIASPEYVYLVQNQRSIMSDPKTFAVIYVNENFYSGGYNEIVITGAGFNNKQIAKDIGAENNLLMSDQVNYDAYKSDLNQIRSFAYIFPGIFAALILVVVYVVLKRTAVKERKQIAIYKALGAKPRQIIKIYLTQFVITFFIAAVLGCVITVFLTNIILEMFSAMFVLPLLSYYFYPWLSVGAVAAALLLCIIPGILSLLDVLKMQPVEAMRPKTPKGGKKILLERIPYLWNKLSFNSKVTFKSMLRSKPRFFAVFLGILGTSALLTLSLGFKDSIDNTKNEYFDKFAKYDLIVNLNPLSLSEEHPALDALKDSEYGKGFQIPAEINGTKCVLSVVEDDFDFLNLDKNKLEEGLIIPEYYAKKWNAKMGDNLLIENLSYKISAVVTQTIGFSIYADFDYIQSVNPDFPLIYNMAYIRGENLSDYINYLDDNNIIYSTIDDDVSTFNAISEMINMLVVIMLVCALALGIAVLYTVGLMNLSARENEYMLMNTLGYSRRKLMLIYIKETIIQIFLALPFGFLIGNLLLRSLQGTFSNSNFALRANVYPLSYIISFGIVLLLSVGLYFITNRQIKKLNIVERLKAQDD